MRELITARRGLELLYEGRLQRPVVAKVAVPPAHRQALLNVCRDERFITYDYPYVAGPSKPPVPAPESYDPLLEPNLYTRFANLDFDNTEAVEQFFGRYGPLGDLNGQYFQGDPNLPEIHGEPVGLVRWVADRLRTLMDLYRALERTKALDSVVRSRREKLLHDGRTVHYGLKGGVLVTLRPDQTLREAVIQGPFRFYLAGELEGVHIVPALEGRRGFRPGYAFHSLKQALFLQFYFDLIDQKTLRRCARRGCPRIFRVTRADKVYCDDICSGRVRAQHQYQREANLRGGEGR